MTAAAPPPSTASRPVPDCRDFPPLTKVEIAAYEIFLDAQPNGRTRVSTESAQRLVATIRHLQQAVRDRERQSDAAFALLAADLTPDPEAR